MSENLACLLLDFGDSLCRILCYVVVGIIPLLVKIMLEKIIMGKTLVMWDFNYKDFLVNTFKTKRMWKRKSSPNLEYTCKIEVSTTMCNPIYSSTRIKSKHEIMINTS